MTVYLNPTLMARLHILWLLVPLWLAGCDDDAPTLVAVSGNAFAFAPGNPRLEGGGVTLLEHPEMSAVSGADGAFRFEGLEAGSKVTVVLE